MIILQKIKKVVVNILVIAGPSVLLLFWLGCPEDSVIIMFFLTGLYVIVGFIYVSVDTNMNLQKIKKVTGIISLIAGPSVLLSFVYLLLEGEFTIIVFYLTGLYIMASLIYVSVDAKKNWKFFKFSVIYILIVGYLYVNARHSCAAFFCLPNKEDVFFVGFSIYGFILYRFVFQNILGEKIQWVRKIKLWEIILFAILFLFFVSPFFFLARVTFG